MPTRLFRFAAIACVVAACVAAPTTALADELQDVSGLVKAGRLDDAEKRADAFLARTPRDAQMRFLKGVIASQRGRRDEAIGLFTGLTQDFPELPESYNNLAVLYAAGGSYDQARAALETAIRVAPNYATAYENLGDVHAAIAAQAYQDARRFDGANAAALRKRDAARALLAGTGLPAVPRVSSEAASNPVVSDANLVRSQRNIGLPRPAGAPAATLGVGATAPDIIVSADSLAVPSGSNVVAIDSRPARSSSDRSSIDADAVAVDAVTAAVQRWAGQRSVRTDELRIRVDGDTATARFRDAARAGKTLTLKKRADGWAVTDERNES